MLKGLSIRAYLTLMVVLFGVVLLIGAAAGLLSLRESNASLQQMYTVDTPAVADLEGSAGQLLRLRLALATYSSLIELNDQEGADAVLKRFDTYLKVSNERIAHFIGKASNGPSSVTIGIVQPFLANRYKQVLIGNGTVNSRLLMSHSTGVPVSCSCFFATSCKVSQMPRFSTSGGAKPRRQLANFVLLRMSLLISSITSQKSPSFSSAKPSNCTGPSCRSALI